MDHFHIPLQSGDDEILKSMRRKYHVQDYKKVVHKLLAAFPSAGFGADVICGYPGESDAQFENTFALMKDLPITHFHVFPYSKRKNTTAAKMDNHIQHGVKKHRVRALMMLGESKLNLFQEDQVGKVHKVLFEQVNKDGFWTGYTTNYVRIHVASEADLSNKILNVEATHVVGNKLFGKILQ